MLPVNFKEANFTFTKPEGWSDEECMDLPVYRGLTPSPSNRPFLISCWQLSKEDLEEIQKTGKIYLCVSGYSMPPVSLFTENPFE